MASSFRRPDFIQPQGPSWFAVVTTLRVAGVPEQEVRQRGVLICSRICGLLHAESNGALRRWPALGAASDAAQIDTDRLFHIALDTVI